MNLLHSDVFLRLLLLAFTSYFGGAKLASLAVVNSNASWFDAFKECKSLGYSIAIATSTGYLFLHIRNYLFQNHPEFLDVPLWTGLLKPNLNDVWYLRDDCHRTINENMKKSFVNNTAGERQCLLLNMSVNAANMANSWYATSCYERHPFICEQVIGPRPVVRYDGMQPQNVLSGDTSKKTYFNTTSENCKRQVRANKVFTTKYDSPSRTCTLYSRSALNLPFKFYLISEDNTTITFVKSKENIVSVTQLSSAVYNESYQVTDLPCYGHGQTTETLAPTASTAVLFVTATTMAREDSSLLDQWIALAKEENVVDEKTLSSYRNKRMSAPDNRPSSRAMGFLGAVFMASVLILIIMSDIPHIIRDLRHDVHQWNIIDSRKALQADVSFFKNTSTRRNSV
ncbi:uncharacterized protein LOC132546222 [Ylistrum balloti]|uniref:uncharacterized protein LOC132546222 n=1 Tax=Ylistrum balloti TaxID=509963 RepID=UPI002905A153|nr:uncharacterized protein LOC132546222 [Ylistrum balloti]